MIDDVLGQALLELRGLYGPAISKQPLGNIPVVERYW